MPIVLGILVGVLIGALAGAVNGLLITQAKLPPFIATLGMMGVARGLTFIVSGSVAIYGLSGAFRNVGEGQIGPIPLPLLYMIVIGVLGHLTLSRTPARALRVRDRVQPGRRAAVGHLDHARADRRLRDLCRARRASAG